MDIKKFNALLMRTAAVLLMLVLVTSGMVSGRFARYVTTAEYSDSARVAKFHIIDNAGAVLSSAEIPTAVIPGYSSSEAIVLQNHSEVAVAFTVTVANVYDNLPLSFRIQDQKGTVLAQTAAGENTLTYTGTIAPGRTDDTLKLCIEWPQGGSGDLSYIGRVDLIRVKVKAEQID